LGSSRNNPVALRGALANDLRETASGDQVIDRSTDVGVAVRVAGLAHLGEPLSVRIW